MNNFPSIDWCKALITELQQEAGIVNAVREWGGRTIGVVVTRGDGLAKDFCIYAKPHATEARVVELKLCDDEDDLLLDEPDYFFRAPFGLVKKLLAQSVDPLTLLRAGEVKVDGDLKFLVPFGQKWQQLGERATARVPTKF